MVLNVSLVSFCYFISYSTVKGVCFIPTLVADKLESRCLLIIVFVKEVDCFIGVTLS